MKTTDNQKIREARKQLGDTFKPDSPDPIKEAKQMREAMEKYGLNQTELAAAIGKSRSSVANSLRLLSLSPDILSLVTSRKISAGHARCLISLPYEKQRVVASAIIRKKLSVRDAEKLASGKIEITGYTPSRDFSPEFRDMLRRMERAFGTRVTATGTENRGRILIDYFSIDDLERICDIIDLAESYAGRE